MDTLFARRMSSQENHLDIFIRFLQTKRGYTL